MGEENLFKLGQKLRDRVTGFTGIAVSRVEYLNGCVQYCLRPEMTKPGKFPQGIYIDDQDLELVDEGILYGETKNTGGPSDNAPSASYGG